MFTTHLKNYYLPDPGDFNLKAVLVSSICLVILYEGLYLVHQLYFSALRHVPGPWWAMSSLPYCRLLSNGTYNKKVRELHEKFGDVVRVAPHEISFIAGEVVWEEVYGFRSGSRKSQTFLKDQNWIARTQPPSLIMADGADHTRYRRILAHAFSNTALKAQEPIVQRYTDLFMSSIGGVCQKDGAVDLVKWYNFLTFDIIADLTFGEAFGCLAKSDDQYVSMINNMLHAGAQGRVTHLQPLLGSISTLLGLQVVPVAALKAIPEFVKFTRDRVDARLRSEVDHPDFISQITRHNNTEVKGMNRDELDSNCLQFLIAGSETSATALCGITYLLCKYHEYMQLLKNDIRGRFSSSDEITFATTEDIPLLNAAISEGLRLYPPVPTGFPRLAPAGGATVCGYYIPENTAVYMSQYAANHSPQNFVEPGEFRPERWMDDPKFDKDNQKTYQPFSFGPRTCIGKHLAYSEMRLALTRLLFDYDIELQDPEKDWLDQKVWMTWIKSPLVVRLRPATSNLAVEPQIQNVSGH